MVNALNISMSVEAQTLVPYVLRWVIYIVHNHDNALIVLLQFKQLVELNR